MNQNTAKQIGLFIEQNLKLILALAAALLLVTAIITGVRSMMAAKEKEAIELLYAAQTKASSLQKDNPSAAISAYSGVLEKFPNTRAAYDANLRIGDLWMEQSKFEEAAKAYTQAVSKAPEAFSKILAQYNLGIAQESGSHYQEAAKNYEEAQSNKAADFLRPELLLAAARCYEALKNIPKAKELYQTVQDKYATKPAYSGPAAIFLSNLAKH